MGLTSEQNEAMKREEMKNNAFKLKKNSEQAMKNVLGQSNSKYTSRDRDSRNKKV
jgi:hypothetical protein